MNPSSFSLAFRFYSWRWPMSKLTKSRCLSSPPPASQHHSFILPPYHTIAYHIQRCRLPSHADIPLTSRSLPEPHQHPCRPAQVPLQARAVPPWREPAHHVSLLPSLQSHGLFLHPPPALMVTSPDPPTPHLMALVAATQMLTGVIRATAVRLGCLW